MKSVMRGAVTALLLGTAQIAMAAPPASGGEQVFHQRCQVCHTSEAGKPATVGPNLAGVVGRKAASTQFNYSSALKASGLTWTAANLDKFLTAPAKLVPGTRMVISVADPAQRKALIDYLSHKH